MRTSTASTGAYDSSVATHSPSAPRRFGGRDDLFWIITEADRSSTTILGWPRDY